MMKHFVFITGASTGIGLASSEYLIRAGYYVIAGVRQLQDADRLKTSLGSSLYPVILDVTNPIEVQLARKEAELIIGSDCLVAIVNNAGIVVSGSILHVPIAQWERQFDINVIGQLRIIQAFMDLLVAGSKRSTHPSRIINMSSVSGKFASPFMGPYAASKFALEALSDSLRRELYRHDIQVVILEPGSIKTPIWEKAKDETQYMGDDHAWLIPFKQKVIENNLKSSLPVERVAERVLQSVRNKHVRTRYLIKSQGWKFNLILMLPVRWVDWMIRKKLNSRTNIRPF